MEGRKVMEENQQTQHTPRYARVSNFNPAEYIYKPPSDRTLAEVAEYARFLITLGVRNDNPLPVHSNKMNEEFLLFQDVFRDMMHDPTLDPDFKKELWRYGMITSLVNYIPEKKMAKLRKKPLL